MTRGQKFALFVAMIAAILAFVFPPYVISGGLIGGAVFVFFRHPPGPIDEPTFNWSCLVWELVLIAASALTALVALASDATTRQRMTVCIGFALEMMILAVAIPQINMVLVPEFTLVCLSFLAFVLSIAIRIQRRRTRITPSALEWATRIGEEEQQD